MEKPLCISLLQFLYPQSPSEENDGSCNGTTHLYLYSDTCENSPFDSLLYAKLKVITLYSHEHEGNYTPTECVGSQLNEIGTPLFTPLHSYRTDIKMGMTWLEKPSLSKRTNGGGPLSLAR